MSSRKKIALLFAMEAEARPLIQHLKLDRDKGFGNPQLPFEHFRGSLGQSLDLLISINGKDPRYGVDNIGTEPATLNAYITLHHFQPDLCINAGTAGGFLKQGAQIGDIYFSTEAFRFHDRRIPIPGFDRYGIGHYPIHHLPKMIQALGLKEGVVTTANALDYTELDLKLMSQNNGSVKEMEAAGIAWVAYLLKKPIFALKAITDFVDSDHPTQDQFLKNLAIASEKLLLKTLATLEYLDNHPKEWG